MPVIELRAGDLALDLVPEAGGAIAGFRHGATALMREMPAPERAAANVRQSASYPLVPFSNRIAHGRFALGGEQHSLDLNFGDHPHTIHGNGWQRPWSVAASDDTAATLVLDHDPARDGAGGWPFAYRAEQRFSLADGRLTIAMALENRDTRAFPGGLGHHPYFPRHPGTTLRFRAGGVWFNGPDMLPERHGAVPPDWDFATAKPVGGAFIDNCFTGWAGEAEIAYPQAGLRLLMSADPLFGHLVVYVPDGKPFFAVEPVSNMNDAINRMAGVAGHGLRVLQPGERLAGAITIAVERTR